MHILMTRLVNWMLVACLMLVKPRCLGLRILVGEDVLLSLDHVEGKEQAGLSHK